MAEVDNSEKYVPKVKHYSLRQSQDKNVSLTEQNFHCRLMIELNKL